MSIKQKIRQAATKFDRVAMATLPSAWPLLKRAGSIKVEALIVNPVVEPLKPYLEIGGRINFMENKKFLEKWTPIPQRKIDASAEWVSKWVGSAPSMIKHAFTIATGGALFTGVDVAFQLGGADLVTRVGELALTDLQALTTKPWVISSAQTIMEHGPFVAATVVGISLLGATQYLSSLSKSLAVADFKIRKDNVSQKITDLSNNPSRNLWEEVKYKRLQKIYEKHYQETFDHNEVIAIRAALDSGSNLSDLIQNLSTEKQLEVREVMELLGTTYKVPWERTSESALELILENDGNSKHALARLSAHKIDRSFAARFEINEHLVSRDIPSVAWS